MQTPSPEKSRIDVIDALRGLALFGVLTMNIMFGFRTSMFNVRAEDFGSNSAANTAAFLLASFFIAERAIAVFSILFGVGLAMQFERLQAADPTNWIVRRLIVLLLFGLLHVTLIWHGDILVQYAVAGLLVLPLLGMSVRVQGTLAGLMFVVAAASQWLPAPWSAPDQSLSPPYADAANQAFMSHQYFDLVRFHIEVLPVIFAQHISILARTIGLCLVGVVAWRLYSQKQLVLTANQLKVSSIIVITSGLCLMFILPFLGSTALKLAYLGPPIIAIGYCLLFFLLINRPRWRFVFLKFVPAGRMAFTNYLSQSVICSMTFYGYGLGWFGRTTIIEGIGFAMGLFAIQMVVSGWWLGRYQYGPLEWLWRSLTYGKAQTWRIVVLAKC